MNHSTFSERLKEAMKLRNLKSSQIEKISENLYNEHKIKRIIKMPVITDYLKGRYEAAQHNIYALALILDVNEVWLMGEDVPMDRSFGRSKIAEINVINLSTNEAIQKIPYSYRTDIAEDDPKNFFAIYATDNSMAPLLDVGDIAIIKKYTEFSNGKTYLLKIKNGKPIIRKIIKSDDERIELQAMNMWNFPTQYDFNFEDIEILGEVVKVENNSAFK
jgi:SOS-response transcriptional repressor LexA